MKKARSTKPACSRMLHRQQRGLALPVAERADFFYCDGQNVHDFCAAVAAGQAAAVALALDVLTAAHWLRPRDRAVYGSCIRSALYTACEAGLLPAKDRRAFFDAEYRELVVLMKRAWHSAPGVASQRAQRRLSPLLECMRRHFGEFDAYVDYDDWPAVPAPAKLLRRAVRNGWFSAGQAEAMEAASMPMLMQVIHGVAEELPSFVQVSQASHAAETLCYFLCERSNDEAEWVVAPWRDLEDLSGIIMAADASFCYVVDDWGDVYAGK
jgi:hypothetical protein